MALMELDYLVLLEHRANLALQDFQASEVPQGQLECVICPSAIRPTTSGKNTIAKARTSDTSMRPHTHARTHAHAKTIYEKHLTALRRVSSLLNGIQENNYKGLKTILDECPYTVHAVILSEQWDTEEFRAEHIQWPFVLTDMDHCCT